MKKILLGLILLSFVPATVSAASKNNPIYVTAEQVTQMITSSLQPVTKQLNSQQSELTTTNSNVTNIDLRVKNLEASVSAIPKSLSVTWISQESVEANNSNSFLAEAIALCPNGKQVLSGGGVTTHGGTIMAWNGPYKVNGSEYYNAWRVRTTNRPSDGTTYKLTVYASCI